MSTVRYFWRMLHVRFFPTAIPVYIVLFLLSKGIVVNLSVISISRHFCNRNFVRKTGIVPLHVLKICLHNSVDTSTPNHLSFR